MSEGLDLVMRRVPGRYAVVRLNGADSIPSWLPAGGFVSVTRTADELSIACAEECVPPALHCTQEQGPQVQSGFALLRVVGPLPFDAVGVLASLAEPLARARIPILALSTFDTDYLLVAERSVDEAIQALRASGVHIYPSEAV